MRLESSATILINWLAGKADVFEVIISIFATLIVIFVCFPVHECAHALAAKLCGDDTAERQGRLTLNPFAHIDPIGAILIFFCRIGYAKPTPVNLGRCKKVSMKTANVLISLAGPLSNLVMSFILLIPYRILLLQITSASSIEQAQTIMWAALLFYYAAQINAFLMVFNLIPVPPFDGFNVLASFLPAKALYFIEQNSRIIQIIVLVLIFSNVLSYPLSLLTGKIMDLLYFPLSLIG